MLERALIAVVLIAVGVLVYRLVVCWQLRRCADLAANVDPLLAGRKDHVPTIVYFTTPTCAPCRLQQTPVLNQLQAELGENGLQLIRVDATQDPDAARRWGVLTVPTTFVLDKNGHPAKVHNGVVALETLRQELLAS